MSNPLTKQEKLYISFSAKKQIDGARVEDDVEVLQPPSISITAGVVPESHEQYVLGKTIDLEYVLEIHKMTDECVWLNSVLCDDGLIKKLPLIGLFKKKR